METYVIVQFTLTCRAFVFCWTRTLEPIIHFGTCSAISTRVWLTFIFLYLLQKHKKILSEEKLLTITLYFRALFKIRYYLSINLLVIYHQWHSLIGYATHCLFCCRESEQRSSVQLLTNWLLSVFEVSAKRLLIKFWTTSRFILKQLNYSLSISMRDIWLGLSLLF